MKAPKLRELLRIGNQLSPRERNAVELVDRLRLVSHAQLAALIRDPNSQATDPSQARDVRRMLQRLTDLGLLARLERRVGGVRAGSQGYVYFLAPSGQRLIAYWIGDGLVRGRTRPEPGLQYVRHRLAVSQLYVDAHLAAQTEGELEVLRFELEPDSWRVSTTALGGRGTLKPDAYVRLGVGEYEERSFVEIDLGTESRPVVRRKLQSYIDYFNAGTEQADSGVFPSVVWLTDSDTRLAVLIEVCGSVPAEYWSLFTVGRLNNPLPCLTGELRGRHR